MSTTKAVEKGLYFRYGYEDAAKGVNRSLEILQSGSVFREARWGSYKEGRAQFFKEKDSNRR